MVVESQSSHENWENRWIEGVAREWGRGSRGPRSQVSPHRNVSNFTRVRFLANHGGNREWGGSVETEEAVKEALRLFSAFGPYLANDWNPGQAFLSFVSLTLPQIRGFQSCVLTNTGPGGNGTNWTVATSVTTFSALSTTPQTKRSFCSLATKWTEYAWLVSWEKAQYTHLPSRKLIRNK